MVTANAFSVTLSLVGAFGLGSISGAFANHYFAQRRETAAERRAATDRTFREDRDQLLELGDRADELKRELGGTRSNYIADGRKQRWTQTERARAKKLVAILDERTGAFRAAGRAIHAEPVSKEVAWMVEVMETARAALTEGEPSPAVELVITALMNLDKTTDAFLRGRRLPQNDLRKAWPAGRPAGTGADRSKSAFLGRVAESRRQIRQERVRSLMRNRPSIQPRAAGTQPRRRPPPPSAG